MGRLAGSVALGTAASTERCSRASWWRRVFVPAAGVSVGGCTGQRGGPAGLTEDLKRWIAASRSCKKA